MINKSLVVSDTGPIITLCKINKLDILHNMFGQVYIPKAVFDELYSENYPDEYAYVKSLSFIRILDVQSQDKVKYILDSDLNLHRGEAEAIILAEEINNEEDGFLIIDDMKARSYAETRGIHTIGAIGVIAQAIRKHLIDTSELETCIQIMKKSSRFYNESLYNALRITAKEITLSKKTDIIVNKIDDKKNEEVLVGEFQRHKNTFQTLRDNSFSR